MSEFNNESPIQVQGRVYSDTRTYVSCKAAPSKKVFRTMLDLSEEALTVRAVIANSCASHPLEEKISAMSAAQVVSYLMGLTEKLIHGHGPTPLSDKIPNTLVARAVPESMSLQSGLITAAVKVEGQAGKVIDALAMDDDLLDSFASFPSKVE